MSPKHLIINFFSFYVSFLFILFLSIFIIIIFSFCFNFFLRFFFYLFIFYLVFIIFIFFFILFHFLLRPISPRKKKNINGQPNPSTFSLSIHPWSLLSSFFHFLNHLSLCLPIPHCQAKYPPLIITVRDHAMSVITVINHP